jgi:hypothetical protein
VLEERVELLAKSGATYLFMVAPNSHLIYPEHLPDGIELVEDRPVNQLRAHLDRAGSRPTALLYPLDELLEEKRHHEVCSRTNSHWNETGGFVAYSMLIDEVDRVAPVRRLQRSDLAFFEVDTPGDLGYKFTPARESPHTTSRMRHRSAELVYDNQVENTGAYLVTECPAAPATRCVLFGDSYSYGILRFLSESFRRFAFAQTVSIDLDVIERERPDVVISLMSERFIVVPPVAVGRGLIAETEAAKRAQGRTRDTIMFWSDPEILAPVRQSIVSPENVERLRAGLLDAGQLREAMIVSTLAYGGLTPGEVFRLRWGQLRRRSIELGPRANVPARRVRLLRPLAEDLQRWRDQGPRKPPATLVFPGAGGRPDAAGWQRICEESLIPAARALGLTLEHPIELRHTFPSLLLQEGVEPREVAVQVGIPERPFVRAYFDAIVHTGRFEEMSADEAIERARHRIAP